MFKQPWSHSSQPDPVERREGGREGGRRPQIWRGKPAAASGSAAAASLKEGGNLNFSTRFPLLEIACAPQSSCAGSANLGGRVLPQNLQVEAEDVRGTIHL